MADDDSGQRAVLRVTREDEDLESLGVLLGVGKFCWYGAGGGIGSAEVASFGAAIWKAS